MISVYTFNLLFKNLRIINFTPDLVSGGNYLFVENKTRGHI